jgi:excisionase family DNA binding protein
VKTLAKLSTMSSNLRIKKICQYCYSEFIAKTSVTKFCCLKCAQKSYKQRKKEEKISKAKQQNQEEKITSNLNSKGKISSKKQKNSRGENTGEITKDDKLRGENKNDVITVKEAAYLLNVTQKTVYNMIKSGKLETYNINVRLTRIKRASIDKLISFDLKTSNHSNHFDLNDSYTINEVSEKFKVSPTYVYHTLKEYNVPKRNDGKYVKVPKNIVNLIFKNFM